MARHTLSCCIVVKNEARRIKACLNNIDILADEIVIVDTGSTDQTCNVVKQWTKQKKAENNVKLVEVKNRFHDEDGDFDFGAAKTFAFQQATKNFVMWLDAPDIVSEQEKVKKIFLKETSKDPNVYFVLPTALTKKYAFVRTRIGAREHSKMVGRIHESMVIYVEKARRVFIPSVIKNSIRETKRKRRDLTRNLRILEKEWKKEKTSRICFYLGNTHRELGNLEDSLKWFRKRVYDFDFKNDFKEEYFKALECIAELILTIKHSDSVHLEDLHDISDEMIEKEPTRVEGYYYLAKYHIEKREWEKALKSLAKYKTCKKPENYKLWLNRNIYTGKAIIRAVEKCKTGIKYKGVLKPDTIEDLNPTRSTFKSGNSQYY